MTLFLPLAKHTLEVCIIKLFCSSTILSRVCVLQLVHCTEKSVKKNLPSMSGTRVSVRKVDNSCFNTVSGAVSKPIRSGRSGPLPVQGPRIRSRTSLYFSRTAIVWLLGLLAVRNCWPRQLGHSKFHSSGGFVARTVDSIIKAWISCALLSFMLTG